MEEKKSIFDLADKFGVESPFGNWMPKPKPIENFVLISYVESFIGMEDYVVIFNVFGVNLYVKDCTISIFTNDLGSNNFVTQQSFTLKEGGNEVKIKIPKKVVEAQKNWSESLGSKFFAVLKSGDFTTKSGEFVLLNSKEQKMVTYSIFWGTEKEGKIIKYTPKQSEDVILDKIRYVYFDKNNKQYNIGEASLTKVQRHVKKGVLSTKKDDLVELIYIKDIPSFHSDTIKFRFLVWNSTSKRWYINPDCLAGLLGAMIELSIEDLGFNGFSDKMGESAGESSSHINGEKGDLRYLSKNYNGEATLLEDAHFDFDRQTKFNEALFKFFWGRNQKMFSENFEYKGKKTLLVHTKHMKKVTGDYPYRHHHHIHLTGFDFAKIIKNNE
jgi:hypothetical protein